LRDAATQDSEDQEQLQLLLGLQGQTAGTVASISQWLSLYGTCVTSLHAIYDTATAPLFHQLHLSTAPLVGLVRLEVDGPDSLVAVAPALQQLVALTHLKACIELPRLASSASGSQHVGSAQGQPLQQGVPCLQHLCPGLRSLHLDITPIWSPQANMDVPWADLLPANLEQLHMRATASSKGLPCAALACCTCLRSLTLRDFILKEPGVLLGMPGLDALDLHGVSCMVDGRSQDACDWLAARAHAEQQWLTKLTGLSLKLPSPAMPLLTAAPNLRALSLFLMKGAAEAFVQQAPLLRGLRRLQVRAAGLPDEVIVRALTDVLQLTCLQLREVVAGTERHLAERTATRSTWAEVLPYLTQLRVLGVTSRQLLRTGLAQEVKRLTQLQCIYIEYPTLEFSPSAVATMRQQLQVLSSCSSLRAVLCWSPGRDVVPASQPLFFSMPEGALQLSGSHAWCPAVEQGRVVCPALCPHLPPGVGATGAAHRAEQQLS
jgi:hypothetical protein